MANKSIAAKISNTPDVAATELELMRIRHQVTSMRQTIITSLNNLEAQINVLLPRRTEPPQLQCDLKTIRSWYQDKPHNKRQ